MTREFNRMAGFQQIGDDRAFHPYRICVDGKPCGNVYQYGVQQVGTVRERSCVRLVLDGAVSDSWTVSPESRQDGYICTYRGNEQTALCVCPRIIYNDLHPAQIIAVSEETAMEAVLVKLYLFASGQFKPGEKRTKSIEKNSYRTTDEFLLEKYDPSFQAAHCEGVELPWQN